MILRRTFTYTTALLIAIGSFISCDKVEEPFTKKITIDPDTIIVQHQKRVLLEDYTGHQCPNCPAAAEIAHIIKEQRGDKVVVIAVHAGWFANQTPAGDFTANYTTPEGTQWDSDFGISNTGNPKGMVDRMNVSTGMHILQHEAWFAAVNEALAKPATIDMLITNTYNAVTRSVNIQADIEFLEDVTANLNLMVVITESGIVSPQKNSGTPSIILDYVHNHVMRAAVTNTYGTQVAVEGTVKGTLRKTFTYVLPSHLIAENCEVVAFIANSDTKEVYQAAEQKLIIPTGSN